MTPQNPMQWLEDLTNRPSAVDGQSSAQMSSIPASTPLPHWLARAQASQSQPQPSAPQNAPAPASPPAPPPAPLQRLGSNQANSQAPAQTPPNQGGSLLNRARSGFGNQERINNPVLPLGKTVVRFELDGLGDPFYRLLGHTLNPSLENGASVAEVLESGGEPVRALEALLEKSWASYDLQGAMLVYRWSMQQWKAIAPPYTVPPDDGTQNTAASDDSQDDSARPQPKPNFQIIRSIDLAMVLNVLARARTQLLLAKAPLIFNQGYLNRVLLTDDPRLVALARATGAIHEGTSL